MTTADIQVLRTTLMRHTKPTDSPAQLVEEWVPTLKRGQSATAWDVARAMGIPPLGAESALENLVNDGKLIKEGNHYAKPEKRMSETEARMQNYNEYQRNLPPWARGPG